MTITRQDTNQVYRSIPGGGHELVSEEVVTVDVTVETNRAAVEQAVDQAHDALVTARTSLAQAIVNVQAKVASVQAVANTTGTRTGAQLSGDVRALAGADIAHMAADRDLMEVVRQMALNQRQMMKLLLLLAKPEAANRLLQVPD